VTAVNEVYPTTIEPLTILFISPPELDSGSHSIASQRQTPNSFFHNLHHAMPINLIFATVKGKCPYENTDFMQTLIICPNCNTKFEPTAAMAQSIEENLRKEYNQKWTDLEKQRVDQIKQMEQQKDAQLKQREQQLLQQQEELLRKAADEKAKMVTDLEQQLAIRLKADYENQMKVLQDTNAHNTSKLAEMREKELEFLKKMQEIQVREQEMELQLQRKLMEERTRLAESMKKDEEERAKVRESENALRMKEMEKQMEDQKRLIEEMRRKAEQGSMQLQGEVQELALEELLKSAFPFDMVEPVGKGVQGADCILTVRNHLGQVCGKIIFESKRTKLFAEDWIEKLKADLRSKDAEIAVLVTQAMPKQLEQFGEYKGVWVCNFTEVRALVSVLRDLLIKVHKASKSHENKGDKMTLLYNYLVSAEFGEQWKAISEGFMYMRLSIQKEREQMEKIWKAREKQLEKVLLNAAYIKGSVEGIAGQDIEMNLLPGGPDMLLE